MIVKAKVGSGFLGTVLYVLHGHRDQADDKCARIIGGNMAGTTARTLSREFGQLRKLRPNLGKAVSHFSLSFSPEERRLTDDELAGIAGDFMAGMGYGRAAYVCVRHEDTEHQHAHVVACRATIDAKTVADGRSFQRAEVEARRIEVAHGLLKFITTKEKKMNENEETKPENDIVPVGGDDACFSHFAVEIGEKMNPRKARELRRMALTEEYRQRIIDALGPCFKSMSKTSYGHIITTTAGGRIIDRGDRITAYRMSNEDAAKHLVAICMFAQGWKSASFSGPPEFLRLAFIEAAANGLTVVPKDEEQQALLTSITDEHQRDAEAIKVSKQSDTLAAESGEAAKQLRALHFEAMQRRKIVDPSTPITPTPQPFPVVPSELPKLNNLGSIAGRLQFRRDAKEAPHDGKRGRRLGPR